MSEITVWIKIGKQFINEGNIRSIRRHGNATIISRIIGDEVMVEVDYDKVKDLLPPNS